MSEAHVGFRIRAMRTLSLGRLPRPQGALAAVENGLGLRETHASKAHEMQRLATERVHRAMLGI